MTFNVDRGMWLCGYTIQHKMDLLSKLRNREGRMCCLGHLAKACGISDDALRGRALVESVPLWARGTNDPRWLILLENTDVVDDIMVQNDEPLSQRVRERELKKSFRKLGIAITFSGRLPRKGDVERP
jgi:hypothetical protein